jgi:sulfate permease, SulP family
MIKAFSFFNASLFKANWKSGLTVSLISIPLSISLAVASGASPVAGIITAIWAGFIAAAFGGSNYNIIGPTGALSGIIASYALVHGPENLPILAIISGIFVLVAYQCRLEYYLIFIPSSVIHGFTLGVACIIGLNQLNFALGLQNITKHEKLIENVIESFKHIGQSSWPACTVFALFFLGLLLIRKSIPFIPGAIVLSPLGIAIGYATTIGILPFHLETLGSKFGDIRPYLVQVPSFTFDKHIILPALVVSFIAIIETMLSARIADTMTKTKHNARKELLGLGFANIMSGLAGGIPATAALARTALNIKTGATSSLSALLSSIFVAVGSFLFLPYFAFIPMAVIAAILVYVAVNMIEREHFDRLFHHDKQNFLIAIFVAAITVYEDPIIGILSGAFMALLLLVNKLAQSYYEVIVHEGKAAQKENLIDAQKKNILIYVFKGKLVYLNSQAHIMRFQSDFSQYAGIILLLNDIYFIDLDGVDALEEIIELIQNRDQIIMIVHPSMHIKNMLHSSKKFRELENQGLVFDSVSSALYDMS